MPTKYIVFKPTEIEDSLRANGTNKQSQYSIRFDGDFSGTRWVVSSITIDYEIISSYLNTEANPNTPYVPQYPGSPATKKYVDDSVSAVSVPTKVSDLTNDSNFQTATQVSQAISTAVASTYKYKGSVANYASLPASGNTEGDVWNVTYTGMNYAWTGSAWDALGTTVDLSAYQEKLTAGDGISIESVVSSDMKGPCPEGYHIPTYQELQKLVSATQEIQPEAALAYPGDSINTSSDMLEWILWAEYKGYVIPNSGNPTTAGQGEKYILWSSEAYDANNAYSLVVEKGQPLSITGTLKSIGASLICFSDEEITELPSGNFDWTENFTNTALYGEQASEGYIIYFNYDNKTKWIKILLTTTLLNDNFYQWGNNTGTSRTSGLAGVSTTQVDASGYGPGNYYSSDTFIAVDTDWSSVRNDNLWGGVSKYSQYNLIYNSGLLSVNSGEGIEIGTVQDYSAMKGPCPEGFHIPSANEWQNVIDFCDTILNDIWDIGDYLKMSFVGGRDWTDGLSWNKLAYWACTCTAYNGDVFSMNEDVMVAGTYFANGLHIRPFSDTIHIPDNTRTTIYDASSVATGAGIFHNPTLGLISISDDGENWITISDKNVGATTVWNSGDTSTQENSGGFFQRGNNYMFPFTGTITTSTTQVDATGYGPGNYYSSDTFIIGSSDWSSVRNNNLRGGDTGVVTLDNVITNTGVLSVNGQTGNVTLNQVDDTALSSSWDGDTTHAPSKNAVYDAIGNIETLLAAL